MSQAELAISLVGVLAWPVTVLLLGLILRAPLKALVGSRDGRPVRRFKAGPVVVEWEQRLDGANRRLAAAYRQSGRPRASAAKPKKAHPEPPGASSADALQDLLPLAETQPTAAVMLAYQRVESALAEQTPPPYYGPPFQAVPAAPDLPMPPPPQRPSEPSPPQPGEAPGGGDGSYPATRAGVTGDPPALPAYPYAAVPMELKSTVDDLRDLRDAVAQGYEKSVSPARAAQYVGVAEGVLQALQPQHSAPEQPET